MESKNNLFKFKNGKFVMTEGYGSVISIKENIVDDNDEIIKFINTKIKRIDSEQFQEMINAIQEYLVDKEIIDSWEHPIIKYLEKVINYTV